VCVAYHHVSIMRHTNFTRGKGVDHEYLVPSQHQAYATARLRQP
jgi:hypothetical protein